MALDEIEFSEDGTEFLGNLEFTDYENE